MVFQPRPLYCVFACSLDAKYRRNYVALE